MTQSFGIFTVADSGKNWSVKGNGASLWNFDNHVVKVQGIVDSKAAGPVLYAQSVQDSGQACGSAATAAANPNGAAPTAAAPSGPTAAATASPSVTPAPAASAEPQQQPGGSVAQNTAPTPPATAQAPAAQAGTTGVTTPGPQTSENKGTPAAGSPAGGAIASNSGASNSGASSAGTSDSSAAASTNYSTFNGCLVGSVNEYQFKANGKSYRLQGNTAQLSSLIKHNVEITGEDFNGKAIQVNGARDLGTSCK
jgi:hypothetical protein